MHPTFSLLHPSLAPRFLTSLSQTTLSPHYHISLHFLTSLLHPNFSSPLSTDSCTPLFHPTGSPSLSPHFPTSLLPHSHTPLSCLTLEPHFLALLGHPISHLTPLSNHFFFTSLLHPSLSLYSCTFLTPLLHPIAHLIFSPLSHLNPLSQPTFLLHSCILLSRKLSHPSLTSLLHLTLSHHTRTSLSHPLSHSLSHLTLTSYSITRLFLLHFCIPSLTLLSHPILLFHFLTSLSHPTFSPPLSPHCRTPLSHLTVAPHSLTPLSHPNLHISLTP